MKQDEKIKNVNNAKQQKSEMWICSTRLCVERGELKRMKQDEKMMLREIKWACRMPALSDGVKSRSLKNAASYYMGLAQL